MIIGKPINIFLWSVPNLIDICLPTDSRNISIVKRSSGGAVNIFCALVKNQLHSKEVARVIIEGAVIGKTCVINIGKLSSDIISVVNSWSVIILELAPHDLQHLKKENPYQWSFPCRWFLISTCTCQHNLQRE